MYEQALPLAQLPNMAVIGEVYGTHATDYVVLKLNKFTRPMIALTLAVFTTTIKKIIKEAG
jgi:hypothetical protein